MTAGVRRRPSWRVSDPRLVRPELGLFALLVLAALLVEVWQSARLAELGLARDRTRQTLAQDRARLEFDVARLDRNATRAELEPQAQRLGLQPMATGQVIELPSQYLVRAEGGRGAGTPSALAWIAALSRAFVPEAIARTRNGS